ncbi:MAG: hypothetical protein ACOZBZ_01795 [Patescibacteria group bacterium]
MRENIIHYLVLLVILDLAIAAFFLFSFNRGYQAAVVVAMGVLYIIWGTVHHLLSEDFHLKVVLEYVLIALLANLVILSLLFRA